MIHRTKVYQLLYDYNTYFKQFIVILYNQPHHNGFYLKGKVRKNGAYYCNNRAESLSVSRR